jgi:hypothetical protein
VIIANKENRWFAFPLCIYYRKVPRGTKERPRFLSKTKEREIYAMR